MATEERDHYILHSGEIVGDCAVFWGPDRRGYTCDLSKAGLYTRSEAWAQHRSRASDVPVTATVAARYSVTHVRIDGLRRALR